MALAGEPFIRGLPITLPVIGTPDDPTACRGDQRFDNPRTRLAQRECIAVCHRCTWLEQCRDAAQALLDAGEKLWGVWGGQCYAIDNDQVTSVTNLLDHDDTRRERSSEGGRPYGGKRPRQPGNVQSGLRSERVGHVPATVVRLTRAGGADTGDRSHRLVPEGVPARLRIVR